MISQFGGDIYKCIYRKEENDVKHIARGGLH